MLTRRVGYSKGSTLTRPNISGSARKSSIMGCHVRLLDSIPCTVISPMVAGTYVLPACHLRPRFFGSYS
ncbi:protein of unknown function [Nocardia cyriacigeorgica GUH-2]|uniref:Uncharacterized protein n=1 Tax=Nocardia cyriacigeorgica (strain GUH-2) TaxID=1127134 RepID=H6QZ80_NOCCG|nr:protein of unknown function [Nocardia cyriacigeorgica GUH-2]